jgi:hypothetical protein
MDFDKAQRCFGGLLKGLEHTDSLAIKILGVINDALDGKEIDAEFADYTSCVPLIKMCVEPNWLIMCAKYDFLELLQWIIDHEIEYQKVDFIELAKIALENSSINCLKWFEKKLTFDKIMSLKVDSVINLKKVLKEFPWFNLDNIPIEVFNEQLTAADVKELDLLFDTSSLYRYNALDGDIDELKTYFRLFHQSINPDDLITEMNFNLMVLLSDYPELVEKIYNSKTRFIILEKIFMDYHDHTRLHERFNQRLYACLNEIKNEMSLDLIRYAISFGYQQFENPILYHPDLIEFTEKY